MNTTLLGRFRAIEIFTRVPGRRPIALALAALMGVALLAVLVPVLLQARAVAEEAERNPVDKDTVVRAQTLLDSQWARLLGSEFAARPAPPASNFEDRMLGNVPVPKTITRIRDYPVRKVQRQQPAASREHLPLPGGIEVLDSPATDQALSGNDVAGMGAVTAVPPSTQ